MAIRIISNSCLFDQGDPDFMTQTFGTPDSSILWTFSCWFKRGEIAVASADTATLFGASTDASNYTGLWFNTSDQIRFRHVVASSDQNDLVTTSTFRDPTGWYHIVLQYDSAQGVAADRVTLWVNNVEITDFDTSNYPTGSEATHINTAVAHSLGQRSGPDDLEFDGQLADVEFVDNAALTPSSFGEVDSTSGAWVPIDTSLTYGANGFQLQFGDSGALGDDTSGNVNDWTPSSMTAANQRHDTPTDNHMAWNPLHNSAEPLITNANRTIAGATGQRVTHSTWGAFRSGKWYWEVNVDATSGVDDVRVGLASQRMTVNAALGDDTTTEESWGLRNPSGTALTVRHAGVNLVSYTDTGTLQTGDYVMVAYDVGTGEVWFGLNGSWLDSGDPGAGTGANFTVDRDVGAALGSDANGTSTLRVHDDDLEGVIPTGFVLPSTDNLATPTIEDPSDHFDVVEWTGNASNPRAITSSLGFSPDFVWMKNHTDTTAYQLFDSVRGATIHWEPDNSSVADVTADSNGYLSVFDANGFTVDAGGTNDNNVNASGDEYVAFCWAESVTAGFDIITYTGTGVAKNEAHSLGVAPEWFFTKNRDSLRQNRVLTMNLLTSASVVITDPETDFMELDTADASADNNTLWDDTAPDASNVRLGTATSVNESGDDFVGYVFAPVEGFSEFGTYIGNGIAGNTESPVIYCGFKPKFVMVKRTDSSAGWIMLFPNTTNHGPSTVNRVDNFLTLDTAAALQTPGTPPMVEFLTTGFKLYNAGATVNASNAEYTFYAFAEFPMKYASAGPLPEVGDKFGDGAISLSISVAATATYHAKHGDGALSLSIAVAGTGTQPNRHAAGNVKGMHFLITSAGTNTNKHGNGLVPLSIGITGTGLALSIHGDGAPGGMSLQVGATGTAGETAGVATLPAITVNATGVRGGDITGGATLPRLTTNGVALNPGGFEGNPLLPKLQTNGEIQSPDQVTLPALFVVSAGLSGTLGVGLARLPLLQTTGNVDNPPVGTGSLALPALRVVGVGVSGAASSNSVFLPILQVVAAGSGENTITGDLVIPFIRLDPDSAPMAAGSIGTGSAILPLLLVDGVLVNAATLTVTAWAMNTETFLTTNYLNFDFIELVSFGKQPYGVTSGGIFLLEGSDDDGTDIDARVLTGIEDFNDENMKELAYLYTNYVADGALRVNLWVDGQTRVRNYDIKRVSNTTTTGVKHARFKGARGLRSRTFQLGIQNLSGADFEIDKLGLLIRVLSRKTRRHN